MPTAPSPDLTLIKALFFDVFGTVVDWRTSVTRSLHHSATSALSSSSSTHTIPTHVRTKASSLELSDWALFAASWRSTYYAFTRSLASSSDPSTPYKTVDQHHYDSLLSLLSDWDLTGLWSADEVREMSLIWHRLDPWSDSCEGIRRLNQRFRTCTLSNGNVGLLEDMAAFAGLEWGEVLSSEMFKR
jgi:2-haloacid dehalogenase